MGAWLLQVGNPGAGMTHNHVHEAAAGVANIIRVVISAFLGLFGLLAVLFFIYVGFRLAKAEDESKRKEAKKQMIYTLVAIVGIVILIVIFNVTIMNLFED